MSVKLNIHQQNIQLKLAETRNFLHSKTSIQKFVSAIKNIIKENVQIFGVLLNNEIHLN